jgi:enoyl-[acyl-carrier-protein] reductase (NADH)
MQFSHLVSFSYRRVPEPVRLPDNLPSGTLQVNIISCMPSSGMILAPALMTSDRSTSDLSIQMNWITKVLRAQVCDCVSLFCSDAAKWITGQVIYADGGAALMNPEVPPEIQLG